MLPWRCAALRCRKVGEKVGKEVFRGYDESHTGVGADKNTEKNKYKEINPAPGPDGGRFPPPLDESCPLASGTRPRARSTPARPPALQPWG